MRILAVATVVTVLMGGDVLVAQSKKQPASTKTRTSTTKKKTPAKTTAAKPKPVTERVDVVASQQPATARPAPRRPRLQGTDPVDNYSAELRVNGMVLGNFFQAPEGVPEEDVTAAGAEVRFRARPKSIDPLEGYIHLNAINYEDLGTSPGAVVGLRRETRPHSFDMALEVLKDRPSFDVGDEFDEADTVRLFGDYSYRLTRNWEVAALGEYLQQSMQVTSSRDNDFMAAGGSIRYRGFGGRFSPEVGMLVGQRDVEDDAEDHSQNDLFFRVRSALTPRLYLSGRYRHRIREYDTIDREDTRHQISLTADYRLLRYLGLNFYLANEDADSSIPTRTFTTTTYAVGLTVRQ